MKTHNYLPKLYSTEIIDEAKTAAVASTYEFYISSSSKDLMRKLGEIMRKQGYIGYADGGGKMHYVIDGSNNLYRAADNIFSIISEGEDNQYRVLNQAEIELKHKCIDQVLTDNNIPRQLKGYNYLRELLFAIISSEHAKTIPDKDMYYQLQDKYNTGRKQIDRVINYAFKKAGKEGSNNFLIAELVSQTRELFTEDKNRLDL